MKPMKRVKAWGLTVAAAVVLGSFALLYFNYFANGTVNQPHAFRGAASTSEACRPCHRSIYDSYVETGHYLTSTVATKATVMGDFGEGRNVVHTPLPDLQFVEHRMYTKRDRTSSWLRWTSRGRRERHVASR